MKTRTPSPTRFGLALAATLFSLAATSAGAEDLKLGLLTNLTGPVAEYGLQEAYAMRMAVADINAAGGVNGGKIVLVEEDEGSVSNVIGLVRKLQSAGVVALLGPQRTATGIAADPLLTQLSLPSLSSSGAPFKHGDFLFKPVMAESQTYSAVQKRLKESCHVSTAAVVYAQDDDYATTLQKEWVKSAADAGIKLGKVEGYATKQTDFSVQLTSVINNKPDVVFLSGLVAQTGPMIRQLRELGYKGIVHVSTVAPNVQSLSEGASDGAVSASNWNSESERPEFLKWKKMWTASPHVKQFPLSIWSTYGYDKVLIMTEAARRAGSNTNSKAIRDQLGSGKPFAGAVGTYRFVGSGQNQDVSATVNTLKGAQAVPFDPKSVVGCKV